MNQHDPEWKHTVGLALFVGVTFTRGGASRYRGGEYELPQWYAHMPHPINANIARSSKYEAAKAALRIMEGKAR